MANRVVILESPDGSGKTTLADYLVQNHGFMRVHTGKPEPDEDLLLSYASKLYDAVLSGKDVVFDRLQLGESVYGPLMRGTDRIGEEGQIILQRLVRAYDVKQVICLPPYKLAFENWQARHKTEYIQDPDIYTKVYAAYNTISTKSWIAWSVIFDYTQLELKDFVPALFFHEGHRCPKEVIGQPDARFLFVGEIANQESLDLPWVDLGNSSHYLNNALWAAGYREDEMAFTNAVRLDKSLRNISALRDQMPRKPHIVALGKRAANFIRKSGISPDSTIEHPAYWKRFHSSNPEAYIHMLRTIRTETYAQRRNV